MDALAVTMDMHGHAATASDGKSHEYRAEAHGGLNLDDSNGSLDRHEHSVGTHSFKTGSLRHRCCLRHRR